MELTLNIMVAVMVIMFIVTPAVAVAEDSTKPVRAFLLGLLIMPSLVAWSSLWTLIIINVPPGPWWGLPLVIALLALAGAISVIIVSMIEKIIHRR